MLSIVGYREVPPKREAKIALYLAEAEKFLFSADNDACVLCFYPPSPFARARLGLLIA